MILKAFKEKQNEKYLNKLLTEREVSLIDNNIESIGVILNIDETDDFNLFKLLATKLNVNENKLKIIAFSSNKDIDLNSWDACFNPKDFTWNGRVKNVEMHEFLDKKYDILISYYEADILELKLMTALSKARFKIGILKTDERLNDLIIKTGLKEFEVFKDEVFKYLTILNKIKNE